MPLASAGGSHPPHHLRAHSRASLLGLIDLYLLLDDDDDDFN